MSHSGIQLAHGIMAYDGVFFSGEDLSETEPVDVSAEWCGEVLSRWAAAGYLKQSKQPYDEPREEKTYAMTPQGANRILDLWKTHSGEALNVLKEHERRTAGPETTATVETFLSKGPATVPAISGATGVNSGSVWKALYRLRDAGKAYQYDAQGQQTDVWLPAEWAGTELEAK